MSRIAQQPWWSIAPPPREPPEYPNDDWLLEIEDEIWDDPKMLAEALDDADDRWTEEELVHMHALKVREERRERGY